MFKNKDTKTLCIVNSNPDVYLSLRAMPETMMAVNRY